MTSLQSSSQYSRSLRRCDNPACEAPIGIGERYVKVVWLGKVFDRRSLCGYCGEAIEQAERPSFEFVDLDDCLTYCFARQRALSRIAAEEARADALYEEERLRRAGYDI